VSILVASLCKNEKSRWLDQVVPTWQDWADEILVIDDESDDGSFEALVELDCTVVPSTGRPMMGHESDIRNRLWSLATSTTHDWIIWVDMDVYLSKSPRESLLRAEGEGVRTLGFTYYDLWGKDVYRDDRHWCAHARPWVWGVKNPGVNNFRVGNRGWHCGHIPNEAHRPKYGRMPVNVALLHLAYSTPESRNAQHEKYAKLWEMGALERREWEHAQTITDKEPNVKKLPFTPEYDITP